MRLGSGQPTQRRITAADPRRRDHRRFIPLASQNLEVFNPTSGTELGSINTNETVTSLFGLTNAEFTVTSDTAAAGGSDPALPTVGSVYDVFNLGNGYENVYTAIPGVDGGEPSPTPW